MAKRRISLGAAVLAGALLLTGCSSQIQAEQMPQDELHQALTAPPSDGATEPASPDASQDGEAPSAVELAAQVGAVFAAELGFDRSQRITGEQLAELAKAPMDTLADVVVLPAQCEAPLEALNWSPAQLGTEVARTDFTNAAGNVAGSIEVAELGESEALEEHFRTVLQMRTECSSIKLNRPEFTETLKFTNPGVQEVESQLAYTRRGNPDTAQDTLVLIQSKGDHVAMVSFISATSLADETINLVGKQILDSVLAQL